VTDRPVTVATASGDVELSVVTAAKLAKRLRLLDTTRPTAAAFESAGAEAIELNEDGKRLVFDELTYWLDSAGARTFPDDARKLFRALADEGVRGTGS
jgi:hypothetical protein